MVNEFWLVGGDIRGAATTKGGNFLAAGRQKRARDATDYLYLVHNSECCCIRRSYAALRLLWA